MKKVVFTNGKGGVAKTTSTLAFAAIASKAGMKVLLVDVDPQGSADLILSRSQAVRGITPPFDWAHETDPQFLSGLRGAGDWDFVFVDTPGSLEGRDVLATVTQDADFVVLPSFADISSLTTVLDTVTMLRSIRDVPHKVLITRAHVQRGVVATDARDALKAEGIQAFSQPIRAYTLYDDLQTDGSLITEAPRRWRQGANALADYTAAWNELTSHWLRSSL